MLATSLTGFINQASHGYTLAFFLAACMALVSILVVLPTKEQRRQPVNRDYQYDRGPDVQLLL